MRAAILILLLLCATRAIAVESPVAYRIRIEEGLDERQSASAYTADEARAVARLKACLDRMPHGLWLVAHNGRLILIKMGADGKPVGGK